MSSSKIEVRKADLLDLDFIKSIADADKKALGFITRATLLQAINHGQVFVATVDGTVAGFQHYYHRKTDGQTTLYQKAVLAEKRRMGIGTLLVSAVIEEARRFGKQRIRLKCPIDLPSNMFHEKYGFILIDQVAGRKRKLNVWEYKL